MSTPDDVEVFEAWFDLTPVHRDWPSEFVTACGEPSPSGAMLCNLPATAVWHSMGQHVGIDRHGNFRGWPDKRATNPLTTQETP